MLYAVCTEELRIGVQEIREKCAEGVAPKNLEACFGFGLCVGGK